MDTAQLNRTIEIKSVNFGDYTEIYLSIRPTKNKKEDISDLNIFKIGRNAEHSHL
jgi:hypothetical protein